MKQYVENSKGTTISVGYIRPVESFSIVIGMNDGQKEIYSNFSAQETVKVITILTNLLLKGAEGGKERDQA